MVVWSPPKYTANGTPYFTEPCVSVVSRPQFDMDSMEDFLYGFDPDLEFSKYLADIHDNDAEQLVKVAGQLCYMSFGQSRSKSSDMKKYLDNIKSSGHGSVLEHVNFTLMIHGICRSDTHEIVRHRAGFAYSQVSQRYVDDTTLRFVQRLEFQDGGRLHRLFIERIDRTAKEYGSLADELKSAIATEGLSKRDARKALNQAARALLPNETEAPIIMTGNVRAWRHFIEMRASEHADVSIRRLAFRVFMTLKEEAPLLFDDYEAHPKSMVVAGGFRKV